MAERRRSDGKRLILVGIVALGLLPALVDGRYLEQRPARGSVIEKTLHKLGDDGPPIQRLEASGELRTYVGRDIHRHEISVVVELPVLYRQRRVMTFPPAVKVSGFDQSQLIRQLTSTDSTMFAGLLPLSREEEQRELDKQRLEATRLLVAWFMTDRTPLPTRDQHKGMADVGQVAAEVFDVISQNLNVARVYVDARTALPIGLSFTRSELRTIKTPPPPKGMTVDQLKEWAAKQQQQSDAGATRSSEIRWTIGDHRRVGGVLFPYSLVIADDGVVREEWQFKSVKLSRSASHD